MILGGQRGVTFEFCASVASALDMPPDDVMRKAKLLPPAKSDSDAPRTAEENVLVQLFRRLSDQARQAVVAVARSLANQIADAAETDGAGPQSAKEQLAFDMVRDLDRLSEDDQRRVYDLMRRLQGDANFERGEREEDPNSA